jgi:nitronate monooxygenase
MVQGLIHDIPTAQDLIDRIIADAEAIIARRLPSIASGHVEVVSPSKVFDEL